MYQVVTGLLVDPRALVARLRELPAYLRNLIAYRRRQHETKPSFRLRVRNLHPVPGDRHAEAGAARGHYFHQDLHVARLVRAENPTRHVDVGSSVGGFVAHLLAFRDVEVVDIRPLGTEVPGLRFRQGNMLKLPYDDQSLPSLSALHSPEHVGLGRYGDPVDPDAWRRAGRELARVVARGGRLYYSVPIGVERVEFDAHRVFDPATIMELFADLELEGFSLVDDAGDLHVDQDPSQFHGWYGCGIFVFRRPA